MFTVSKRLLAAAAAVLLVTACGGGGNDQYRAFAPARIVNFGDELSVFTADAKKYSVNFASATVSLDCKQYPLWIQALATSYSKVYAQCNPDNLTTTTAQTQATVGAKVADVQAQVTAFNAGSAPLGGTDLVTVLVGGHDVMELYATYPTQSEAAITDALATRGRTLATLVNSVAAGGSRVLIATTPDVSLTPWAAAEKAAHTDTDRVALLGRLVTAFNTAMRTELLNDGSKLGLLLGDDLVRGMVRAPSAYALVNVTDAVCATALPDCTPLTLIAGVTSAPTYLWADTLRPASTFHAQFGLQAVSRTRTNPF